MSHIHGQPANVMNAAINFRARVFLCLGVLNVAACGDNFGNPRTIHDTTGAVFDWVCHSDGCDASAHPGTPPPGCGTFYGYFLGPVVTICAATPFSDGSGWTPWPDHCRVVACTHDADCPQLTNKYRCTNGLCETGDSVKSSLDYLDVVGLCLSTIPRADVCSSEQVNAAIKNGLDVAETTCPQEPGQACAVPATCRQP